VRTAFACAAACVASLLAGCGIDFNTLVAVFDASGLPSETNCTPTTALGKSLVKFQQPNVIHTQIFNTWATLPQPLQDDSIVRAILSQAQSVSLKTSTIAHGTLREENITLLAQQIPSPVFQLSHADFHKFANLVSEYAIRQPTGLDPFSQLVITYYQAYYAGSFNSYFGVKFAKPVLSLTVRDNEINQAATVFVEALFDEALKSPVWKTSGNDGKAIYYPGGNIELPTVATLPGREPVTLPAGCMNLTKAKTVSYVAQQFATAASSDTALAIKSVGGLEIGLGLLGKLSIGDNSTLSNLIKAVASEVVLRITAQVVYSALIQIDIPRIGTEAQHINNLSARFISPKRIGAPRRPWL
jgi:hypothetical protein